MKVINYIKMNFNFRALDLDDAFFEKITELDWKKLSLKPESQAIKVMIKAINASYIHSHFFATIIATTIIITIITTTIITTMHNATTIMLYYNHNALSHTPCITTITLPPCVGITTMYHHNIHVSSQPPCIITITMYHHNHHVSSQSPCIITTTMYDHNYHVSS